jgi:23S rRNA (cytosine1962-C5)-methyltransferase
MKSESAKRILLKKREEHRILSGHPWVFSNQVAETDGSPDVGDLVDVVADGGTFLGSGLYNPHSLIACRIVSRTPLHEITTSFFLERLSRAIDLRRMLFAEGEAFRVVHGEADYLPGVLIDKYNHFLCIQTVSAGMDRRLPLICDALEELLKPEGIIERNETPLRTLENLPQRKGVLRGTSRVTSFVENGVTFLVDPMAGQKTGFYLDQRENRMATRRFTRDASVLDCFCNDGGFALHAAYAGASDVLGVDSSSDAIGRATRNALENKLTSARFREEDVFECLKELHKEARKFDVVILDPPSFTRSKKNVQSARKGYRDLHSFAFRVLKPGGILATASCSHHIRADTFREEIVRAAGKEEREIQELCWLGAAADHPTLPLVPETGYLKFGLFRVH